MSLSERVAQLFRRTEFRPVGEPALTILPPPGSEYVEIRSETALVTDRLLTSQERAIAEWLLRNANPPAVAFIPQLDHARVIGHCTCGCPTINLAMLGEVQPADSVNNLLNEATGQVNEDMVGVMLFQAGGYLSCLEVYDLSDITHPYGLPEYSSLRPLRWESVQE